MPSKQNQISPDELIRFVAAEHKLLLKPDDPAFAIVSMNQLVLNYLLERIHKQMMDDLAAFDAAAQNIQSRGLAALGGLLHGTAAEIRGEIRQDIKQARLNAVEIVKSVSAAYEGPMLNQKTVIFALAAVVMFLIGALVGRIAL